MYTIQTGKELHLSNVLSLRKKMKQAQINEELVKVGKFLADNGIKKDGPLVTTTYSVDQDGTLDMELLVPMDRLTDVPSEYILKPQFILTNALYTRYEGDPSKLQVAYAELIQYIKQNKLHQITTGYNVGVKDVQISEGISVSAIDIYIGVSNNKL